MKKIIARSILLILCLALIGWGTERNHWWGYVTDKATGDPVVNAKVTTTPSDGLDYTAGPDGSYNLCNCNGMVDDEYYYWIHAQKGAKLGKVAVDAYYWEVDPPVQRDIQIEVPPEK